MPDGGHDDAPDGGHDDAPPRGDDDAPGYAEAPEEDFPRRLAPFPVPQKLT